METNKTTLEKLACDIADEMLRLGEGCTEDQLSARFTRAQLAEHGEAARSEAYRRAQHLAA